MTTHPTPSRYVRMINIAQTREQPRRRKVRAGVWFAHDCQVGKSVRARDAPAHDHLKEGSVDSTTLLIIIVILLVVGGGGWYGRGRWY
jgi:hypothetical protein